SRSDHTVPSSSPIPPSPGFGSPLEVQRSSMDEQPVTQSEKNEQVPRPSSLPTPPPISPSGVQRPSIDHQPVTKCVEIGQVRLFSSVQLPPPIPPRPHSSPYPFEISSDGYAPQLVFDSRRMEGRMRRTRRTGVCAGQDQETARRVTIAGGSQEKEPDSVETREVREMPEKRGDEVKERREEKRPAIASIEKAQRVSNVEKKKEPVVRVREKAENTDDVLKREEKQDARYAVAATPEKPEDVIVVREGVDSMVEGRLEIIENGKIEQEAASELSIHERPSDVSDVIVEESENHVDGKEDVVVEEAVEDDEEEEGEMNDSDPIESIVNYGMARVYGSQSSIVFESDEVSYYSDSDESRHEVDSDDLLSGEEDTWRVVGRKPRPFYGLSALLNIHSRRNSATDERYVGSRPLSRLSIFSDAESLPDTVEEKKAHDFAAGDDPPMVMEEEEKEEKNEEKSDPVSSPTVPLDHEDTVLWSDDETTTYDTVSESNTVSDGEGRGYGRFMVPPDEWDEEDQIRHGYKRMSSIAEDSQEEDAVSFKCASQKDFEKEENDESMDHTEKRPEEEGEKREVIEEEKNDEEKEEEKEKEDDEEEGGEQRDYFSITACLRDFCSPIGEDSDDEEEQKVTLLSSDSAPTLEERTSEEEEEKVESEQRDFSSSSSTTIRRWSRMNAVDQEVDDDYRSMESEYHSWLTREDSDSRRDSMENYDSSDSDA
ncbi:hypothetical protein PENTCL1PPCAC_7826, partial [Pristionchus entomophagus]